LITQFYRSWVNTQKCQASYHEKQTLISTMAAMLLLEHGSRSSRIFFQNHHLLNFVSRLEAQNLRRIIKKWKHTNKGWEEFTYDSWSWKIPLILRGAEFRIHPDRLSNLKQKNDLFISLDRSCCELPNLEKGKGVHPFLEVPCAGCQQ